MFTLQVVFMSPTLVGIVPSIEMVIFCAVGGRLSLFGAIYGTLLVSWAKTTFSELFPELWLFGFGGLFIAVVLLFPNGLAGIYRSYAAPHVEALLDRYWPQWRFAPPRGGSQRVIPKPVEEKSAS